jgi:hypothetical protein
MNKEHPYRTPGIALASILGAWAIFGIACAVNYEFNTEVRWNKEVHGHMENAYYASTPELMVKELSLAVKGMHNLGLGNDDYAYMQPWKQTPDHRMDYEYAHMQAIIDRANDVIKWRDSQGDNGSGAQLNDVYGQKVDAVRHFMKDDGGWSDDIAHGAYYVVNYPFLAALSDFGGLITLPAILVTAAPAAIPLGLRIRRGV